MGHGFVAHFGYDDRALHEALDACGSDDTKTYCYSGAFMEYNEHTMQIAMDPSAKPRPLTATGLDLCADLSGDQKTVCVVELPRWWDRLLIEAHTSKSDAFRILGERCIALDTSFRGDCFRGIGAAVSGLDSGTVEETGALCRIASTSTTAQEMCLFGAARMYTFVRQTRNVKSVCAFSDIPARCEAFATDANLSLLPSGMIR
jgi:hypothetical protein